MSKEGESFYTLGMESIPLSIAPMTLEDSTHYATQMLQITFGNQTAHPLEPPYRLQCNLADASLEVHHTTNREWRLGSDD